MATWPMAVVKQRKLAARFTCLPPISCTTVGKMQTFLAVHHYWLSSMFNSMVHLMALSIHRRPIAIDVVGSNKSTEKPCGAPNNE